MAPASSSAERIRLNDSLNPTPPSRRPAQTARKSTGGNPPRKMLEMELEGSLGNMFVILPSLRFEVQAWVLLVIPLVLRYYVEATTDALYANERTGCTVQVCENANSDSAPSEISYITPDWKFGKFKFFAFERTTHIADCPQKYRAQSASESLKQNPQKVPRPPITRHRLLFSPILQSRQYRATSARLRFKWPSLPPLSHLNLFKIS
ncbi:hypothetical protein B0H14DRAFT_2588369 [Mycena olivaceomarginata]|nr:hypothetical protein B0H14DRAFT_2588369 [Mycena olivaceomarginata]